MSKPEETFPADVEELAIEAWDVLDNSSTECWEPIARAIMVAQTREREACADVALKHAGVDRADNTRFVAHNIAMAIRSRS